MHAEGLLGVFRGRYAPFIARLRLKLTRTEMRLQVLSNDKPITMERPYRGCILWFDMSCCLLQFLMGRLIHFPVLAALRSSFPRPPSMVHTSGPPSCPEADRDGPSLPTDAGRRPWLGVHGFCPAKGESVIWKAHRVPTCTTMYLPVTSGGTQVTMYPHPFRC